MVRLYIGLRSNTRRFFTAERRFDFRDFRLLAQVLDQDPFDLLDCIWVRLGRVTGADNLFRLDSFDMRAFVGDHAIRSAYQRTLAEHRDDRVRSNTGVNFEII